MGLEGTPAGVPRRDFRGFASVQYGNIAGLEFEVAGNPRVWDRSRAGARGVDWPDVRRQTSSLNAPYPRGGDIINVALALVAHKVVYNYRYYDRVNKLQAGSGRGWVWE